MVLLLIALAVVSVIALIVAGWALLRTRGGPNLVGKTVVVHTKLPDDRSIRGILHGTYADRWTLRDAVALFPGGHEQPLGGVEHIPVANISFVQELAPPAAEVT